MDESDQSRIRRDGHAVHDAMLEFSQVDSEGRYPSAPAEIAKTGCRGFARVGTVWIQSNASWSAP